MAERIDAREHLRGLVGKELRTLRGRPNRILEVRGDDVIVATQRSPRGQQVQMNWVQDAVDSLVERGELEITVESVGYRSAFIGAVLLTVPGVTRIAGQQRLRFYRG